MNFFVIQESQTIHSLRSSTINQSVERAQRYSNIIHVTCNCNLAAQTKSSLTHSQAQIKEHSSSYFTADGPRTPPNASRLFPPPVERETLFFLSDVEFSPNWKNQANINRKKSDCHKLLIIYAAYKNQQLNKSMFCQYLSTTVCPYLIPFLSFAVSSYLLQFFHIYP
ncbi:unnamed protein product [Acanthosepion pharaonis]|uniref:Uncharacterized protein n=1 Tax=Acanthosepion pharaonis TaxID=158019 RepID=A0A812BWX4_ACAPH|nr:unnamed protein product [Sepia pharaonis]